MSDQVLKIRIPVQGSRPPVNPTIGAKLLRVEQLVRAAQYEDAAVLLDTLLSTHPSDPYANFRGGWLCALRGHYEQSLPFFARALAVAPMWSEALNALGAVLMRMGRYDEGYPYLQAALQAEPRNPEAWINLANWAEGMGQDDLALDILAKAGSHPGNLGAPGIRWARSFIELKRGEWTRGWPDYECRWLNAEWVAGRNRTFREGSQFWFGGPLAPGVPLLVHWEQGMGDMIQMLRYLPWLRAVTPARILLQLQAPLMGLARRRPDLYDELWEEEPSAYDWHVSLMSLPSIHGTTITTIPPPLRIAA